MKFFLMSRIDLYVGFLFCHLLGFFYKIFGKTRRSEIPDPPKKILIIKFLGFGSIIMVTPLMAGLKKNSPETEIHFLTFSDNIPICQSIALIDRSYYLEKKSLWKFVVSSFRALYQIRKQNYDAVFNLEFFSNFSLLFSALTKSKLVLCFGGRHEYRKALSHRIISYENEMHIMDKYFNFIRSLNIEPPSEIKKLVGLIENSEAAQKIRDFLDDHGVNIKEDFLVVVNINAGEMSSIRKWPLEDYQQVISFLLGKKGVKIILIGGKEDVSYVSQLEEILPPQRDKIINFSGKISLKELISLMKISHLYLGNDSGPLHMAEACGLPNISFFGPESPKVYGHSGEKNYTFYSNLPCSPCLNVYTNKDTRCKDNVCLKMIPPDQVIKILQEKYFKES